MLPMLLSFLMGVVAIVVFYRSMFPVYRLPSNTNTEVLAQGRYEKLVYVVLDGLRFDGLVPVNKEGHYYNHMTVYSDPAVHSVGFLSVAGTPTATTPRIVSLMTGAPSNALEILTTFGTQKISADTLVAHSPPRTAFYGDECWVKSFKELRKAPTVLSSYSKYDQSHLEDEMADGIVDNLRSSAPDDFIFAHFTTLDTYGHAFGIDHSKMEGTLRRFNAYLYRIYEALPDDALLVVVSDHGVTNEGQHGCSSALELASVCAFFTKDELPLRSARPATAAYKSSVGRYYDVGSCNGKNDWVQARQPYDVIHQNDIVVTVSYLLGIPPPFNAFGNLIPYLVDDEPALASLLDIKRRAALRLFGCDFENQIAGVADAAARCYALSEQMHTRFVSQNRIGFWVVLALGAVSMWQLRSLLGLAHGHVLFTLFMVIHSLFSFASEDYIWLAALLLENPCLENLVAAIFYVRTPGRPCLQMDRLALDRRWRFANLEKFSGFGNCLPLIALFVLLKSIRWETTFASLRALARGHSSSSKLSIRNCFDTKCISSVLSLAPQLLYALCAIAGLGPARMLKWILLCVDLSLNSLVAIHLRPYNAILLLLFMRHISAKNTPTSLYILLSILPYFCDLENMVASLNWDAFFTFTDTFNIAASAISALCYILVPRILVLQRFCALPLATRDQIFPFYFFGLYFSFVCSWIQFGTLAFQNFFINRLLFTTLYFLIDVTCLLVMRAVM
ncbi:GPI ethanolamine phosphate transferase 3 subunit O [Pancytospora philotis]|nr:GPI ethanolamine phosphate transferase 3 subunit O [Pancytospora philotis]